MIVEREFDSRALEKEQVSQEVSNTRLELRKLENDLQNTLRKLNDANDDVTAKQNRIERLERELEEQRRACRTYDLEREEKTNQVSCIDNFITLELHIYHPAGLDSRSPSVINGLLLETILRIHLNIGGLRKSGPWPPNIFTP